MEPLPFQSAARGQLIDHIRAGARRILLVLPTGAGKGWLAAHLAAGGVEKRTRSLFMVGRRIIVQQHYEKLREAGIWHERIGVRMAGDRRRDDAALVQIACTDTLLRWRTPHKNPLPPVDWITVDEAHLQQPAYAPLIERWWPEAIVIGLTASPVAGMGPFWQQVVQTVGMRDLIAQGHLASYRAYSSPADPDVSAVPTNSDGEYKQEPLCAAVNKPTLLKGYVQEWQRLCPGRKTLAFGVDRRHAEGIAAAFASAGVWAGFLHSGMSDRARESTMADFSDGKLTVLASCDALSEGYDCKVAEVALLLRPTMSLAKQQQQVGRVLRRYIDPQTRQPKVATILDCAGNLWRHGLPDEPHEYSLTSGTKRRAVAPLSQCGECLAVFPPAPVCPVCQHARVTAPGRRMRQKDGRLVEADAGALAVREPTREEYRAQLVRQAHAIPVLRNAFARAAFVRKRLEKWEAGR